VRRDSSERVADERRRRVLTLSLGELSASLSYEETLPRVAALAVPELADCFVIYSVTADGSRRLAARHVDPERQQLLERLPNAKPPSSLATGGAFAAALNGSAVFLPRVTDGDLQAAAQDEEDLALLRQLRVASCIVVPLSVEGRVLGLLLLATSLPERPELAPRLYDQKDFELALALADRVALAMHHASLYSEANAARRDAERANRIKDEFLAMLGHELRNPLAPIATALQLMKLRAPNVLARERAVLERQVEHLVTLVSDLLDVSRIARGKLELRREAVDLADSVNAALELSGPLIEQRRHVLQVDVPRGFYVYGDPARLAQVLTNLLNNAAKYTPPGGRITVDARSEGEALRLRVVDSGAGISPELLPQIFDLFVQDKQALDRSQGGLGLGLAIVRNVVEMHGGRVVARSAGVGQGSELEVTLPLLTRPSLAPSAAPSPRTPAPSTGAKVLVVDDNEDALCLLSEALALSGYQTHTATDPAQALVMAEQVCPDVALLDIGLPVMDGYELARRLRAQRPEDDALKLVAITGYGQPGDREQARLAGFDEHMVKPVRVEELQRVLTRLLEAPVQPSLSERA
jgi:signal transduction histidine kinase/ActR/RegA family two-component response regulator